MKARKMKNKFLLLEILILLPLTVHSQGNIEEVISNGYADSLFRIGENYFLEHNFDEAKKIFNEHLVLLPNDKRSLEYLSQIAIAQQNIPSIRFYNEEILRLDHNNIDALINLGVIYINEGLYTEAENLFLRAISIEPVNEEALYNLGVLYSATGNVHSAVDLLNSAVQINPQNGKIYQTLGLYYLQIQSYDEAEKNLLKAVSIDQGLIEAKMGLIILYQNQNRLKESDKYINEIIKLSPNYPQLNLLIANQKFMVGETDSAIVYALKEIQEEPNQADVYYFLSTLYGKRGELLKSQNAFYMAEKLLNKKRVESTDVIESENSSK